VAVEANEILKRVTGLLEAQFPVLKSLPLEPNTVLVSSGYLDSFAIVTLVSELESSFHFDINVDALDVSSFETPAAIASLCEATLRAR
jgi:acyl carrier protein